MKRPIVTRDFALTEIRSGTRDDGQVVFRGYATVFDQPEPLTEGIREVIRKGAFKRTLDNGGNVYALWNHNTDMPIASTSTGTLTLKEDDKGLYVEIMPNNSTAGRDARENIGSGLINKMSFAFEVVKEQIINDPDVEGGKLREIKEVKLWEVSPVTFPFYKGTSIAMEELRKLGIDERTLLDFVLSNRGNPDQSRTEEMTECKDSGGSGELADSAEEDITPAESDNADSNTREQTADLSLLRSRLLLLKQ